MSISFERAFADAERSAAAAAKAGTNLVSAARAMQKAAQEGDIGKLRASAERLSLVAEACRQDVTNAKTAWPFSEEEQESYLKGQYEAELRAEAQGVGLQIYERDARLLAYPSILQIMPTELAVKVDKKRIRTIRPSFLVRTLLNNQKKKSRYPVERFLESLFNAYTVVRGEHGSSVKLAQIYNALTLLPGAITEYGKSDFARDIYMLDRSGVRTTRSGAALSFPSSTGTRGGGVDVFSFVGPDGEIVNYYGVQFAKE